MSKPKQAALYDVIDIQNLQDLQQKCLTEFADRVAFKTKPERGKPYVDVTYAEFDRDITALGTAFLNDLGQTEANEARIAILAETCYPWYVTYLAAVNGEAVIVPLDKELPPQEIVNLLNRAKVTCLAYSEQLREKVETALGLGERPETLTHLVPFTAEAALTGDLAEGLVIRPYPELIASGQAQVDAGDTTFADTEIDNEQMRILLFTSGTTAGSKAVMHNHRAIAANLRAMASMTYISKHDVFLSVLPLHHTYECTCGFLCPIYRGATVAHVEGLRYIAQNMQEAKATVILVVPLLAETLHKRVWQKINADPKKAAKVRKAMKLTGTLRRFGIDLRRKIFRQIIDGLGGSLRLFISGGAYVNPQILEDFTAWGILGIQGYGLTECAPILALNRDIFHNPASAGLPMPGVDMKIVNPDENGIGEIIGKGPNLMMGYYEDPEATAEAIRDGYFHTGDLGYMDADNFVFITGRKKNVIVTENGKNIYPEEIESILGELPLVQEVVITAKPGQTGREVITAEIFPDADAVQTHFEDRTPSSEELHDTLMQEIRRVNKDLAAYKAVKQLIVRDEEFTKNTSRKIKRDYTDTRTGIQTDEA